MREAANDILYLIVFMIIYYTKLPPHVRVINTQNQSKKTPERKSFSSLNFLDMIKAFSKPISLEIA